MNLKDYIIKILKKGKEIKTSQLVKKTGFSRAYIDRVLKELRDQGLVVLVGKTNQARYVLSKHSAGIKKPLSFRRLFKNELLVEDRVLAEIKQETGIFIDLKKNVSEILDYSFSEMLNNAIEHSRSDKILVEFWRTEKTVKFKVEDWGVGIFNDIKRKFKLKSKLEAIDLVLKGKHTTKPETHSGEGIFFTSRVGDRFLIESSEKKVVFDNLLEDIYLKNSQKGKGTRVSFEISKNSKRKLNNVFAVYTSQDFVFDRTKVVIKLSKDPNLDFVSRSQARRILFGLEKFKRIVFDFKDIETVGQGFVDEIFRVWKKKHPEVKIEYINASDNVDFMIKRSLA